LNALHFTGLAAFWITALLIVAAMCYFFRRHIDPALPVVGLAEGGLLVFWLVFMAALAFLAIFVPPNSWDAMSYHMGRVAHWVKDQNVAYFPTHIDRQLWSMPLAEYIILHLQILSGSDRFANMVQWAALAGCGVGVSLISGMFGVPRAGQIAALLITTGIPMAVLEATSTQNDLVVAFWLVCFLVMLFKWLQDGQRGAHALWAGAALGLACFTKGTAYLVAPAFIILMLAGAPVKSRKIAALAGTLVLGIVIFTGFFHYRNIKDYQSINPAAGLTEINNKEMSLALFVSNLSRHAGVHLQTPFQKVNNVFIDAVMWLHQKIGVSFTDPRTTIGEAGFLLAVSAYHEYYAGNFLHFWLGLLCCCLVYRLRGQGVGSMKRYMGALLVCGLAFVLYLRWQPWISRLQLPLFIMLVPVIAGVIYALDKKGRLLIIAGVLCLAAATPWIIKGKLKPLVGKKSIFTLTHEQRYFINRPYLYAPFTAVKAAIATSPCRELGLMVQLGSWEYPYWALFKDAGIAVDLRHVAVKNASRKFEDQAWQPCAIIQETGKEGPDEIIFRAARYTKVLYEEPIGLYLQRTE
jgi:hypothetical protein